MTDYYVYIMASHTKTLYVGVTNDLLRRVREHQSGHGSSFTARFHVGRLAYFESAPDAQSALEREKQLKSWRRSKKLALIETDNPRWTDLSYGWYDPEDDAEERRAAIPRLRSE